MSVDYRAGVAYCIAVPDDERADGNSLKFARALSELTGKPTPEDEEYLYGFIDELYGETGDYEIGIEGDLMCGTGETYVITVKQLPPIATYQKYDTDNFTVQPIPDEGQAANLFGGIQRLLDKHGVTYTGPGWHTYATVR